MYKKYTFLTAIVIIFFSSSCKKDNPSKPNLVTTSSGTYLLFDADENFNSGKTSTPSEGTSLYYTKLDGLGLTQLTHAPTNEFDYRAAFSADGKQVIFVRDDYVDYPDTVRSIRIIDITGNNLRTVAKGNNIDYPSFSADGTQIVYAKGINDSAPYDYEMYVANSDGANEKKITTYAVSGDVSLIHWSKDGKIYFNAGGNNITSGIYSIGPDGSNQKFVIAGGLLSISPDSKYLLYTTLKGLFYCNADGTNTKTILSFTGTDNVGNPAGAAWTEDQKQVYFYFYNSGTNAQGIYKINIDGTNLTQVLKGYYEVPSVY